MAHIIKCTVSSYGSVPTDIVGLRQYSWTAEYQFVVEQSDGAIGPTSYDLIGMVSSGILILSNLAQIQTMMQATQGQLRLGYTVSGGTARERIFDKVSYRNLGPVILAQEPPAGPITAHSLAFRGIFVSGDADFTDHMTVS